MCYRQRSIAALTRLALLAYPLPFKSSPLNEKREIEDK